MAIVRKKNNSTKGSTSDATTPKEIKHGTKPYTTTRRSHFTKLSRRTKIPETTNINCALSETQWKASKAGGDHHSVAPAHLRENPILCRKRYEQDCPTCLAYAEKHNVLKKPAKIHKFHSCVGCKEREKRGDLDDLCSNLAEIAISETQDDSKKQKPTKRSN